MSMLDFTSPLKIIFTTDALVATDERLFKESRNRSARIRKKLIKRHGGEFRMKPTMWRAGSVLYAHPAYRTELSRMERTL